MNSKALLILAFLVLMCSSVVFSDTECGDRICDDNSCCYNAQDMFFNCYPIRPEGYTCYGFADCECEEGLECKQAGKYKKCQKKEDSEE